jgi:hypothetical protein
MVEKLQPKQNEGKRHFGDINLEEETIVDLDGRTWCVNMSVGWFHMAEYEIEWPALPTALMKLWVS